MYVAFSDGFQLQRLYGVTPRPQAELIRMFFSGVLTPDAAVRFGSELASASSTTRGN
jgi:hypothetical protein